MRVELAGYNVDTRVLDELQRVAGDRKDVTPEVLSASYARISRDPRTITEIRKDAREEVDKARRSNSTIIFKMGHHSVAEHAVFNLDITGVSRYAMEELEKFRLCSYTEKSQRYITLEDEYVVPAEIRGTRLEPLFTDTIRSQNAAYARLYEALKARVFADNPELAGDARNHNLLEGWAKEDARYVTSLATASQVGQTLNARNLELLLRRFASHPLSEVKDLGKGIYDKVSAVAPSIVIFHQENDRDKLTYPGIRKEAERITVGGAEHVSIRPGEEVQLAGYTPDGDVTVAASMLHTVTDMSFAECLDLARALSPDKLRSLFRAAWENLQFYDSMIREFEYVSLTYDIVLSAACFGQLKRHRMATLTSQAYDPRLGVTVPLSVREAGLEDLFMETVHESEKAYAAILEEIPLAAPYVLTNAHRKRVLMRVNARELYHISRLREDPHAQWDIRNVSRGMCDKAREVMPLTFSLAGGKDRYNELYRSEFGHAPRVTEVSLPGARPVK